MKSEGEHKPTVQTELSRDLGLVSALSIGVGTMIAAGIFTLSGLAIANVGSAAIVAFLLAAVVAAFTALTYCEFSSIYPESGEAYLYAQRTFPGPVAYMVGWCLLLGYTASCGFYLSSFSSYFNEFIWHSPLEMFSGLLVLAALTLINVKGTKESGRFQVVVTVGKVALLLWFVIGGLGHVDPQALVARFSKDVFQIGSTAALVFITFFGFSAIAASAGEVRNPTRVIPRAILLSMVLVTVLYTLVVLVMVSAHLKEYSEAAMGAAAVTFLGPVGGMVIVAGALFSMVSASNASIMAGSRVALSMSQRGHLPREIGAINPRTRTPVVALLLVGGGIGLSMALLGLETLAHFADCVLLLALILVNLALIFHRRRYPHLRRPFRVPLVPVLPGLGILANGYLLTRIDDSQAIFLAAGALVLGFAGYLAWKGTIVEDVKLPGAPSRVALERSAGTRSRYPVLVPIANPANVDRLVALAAAVAKPRQGELILLRVVLVPEQLPPRVEEATVEQERQVLEAARARAEEQGVPLTSLVRIGHNAAKAILETARERGCHLIVLGWKGHTSTARRILGETTDTVVTHARTDLLLVKMAPGSFGRLLLPTAGGVHAQRAEEYATDIAQALGGKLTLCSVLSPEDPEERLESETERLKKAAEGIERSLGPEAVETLLVRHRSVSDAILEEARNHDTIVVGAAGQSFSNQILFGSIPESIAREADCPVIVVKRHHAVKALVGRVMSE